MTRPKLSQPVFARSLRPAFVLALLGAPTAGGCADDPTLTLRGRASIEVDGANAGYDFGDADSHLSGTTTGSCRLTRVSDGNFALMLDLYQSGTGANVLESLSVMGRTDTSTGAIAARWDGVDYTSSSSCTFELEAYDGGDARIVSQNCSLTSSEGSATADVDLTLHNCAVL